MNARRIIEAAGPESCHPWPRRILSPGNWAAMAEALRGDRDLSLVSLWADTTQVHTLLLSEATGTPVLASVPLEDGQYAALSPARPGAALFERLVHDLWGHVAAGAADLRPWVDHGVWPHTVPLSPRPGPPVSEPELPEFPAPAGEALSQLPIGPVLGSIDGGWHLRLTLRGETVIRAEARLGYTHKGSLALMRGKSPRIAARFVARLAAEGTVAHSLAFALATESALAIAAPPRATTLRRLMLELERIAVHLDDLGRIAEAVDAQGAASACGEQREHLLRGLEAAFGHRLMMDIVVPGGIAGEITTSGLLALRRMLGGFASALSGLRRRFEAGAGLDRLAGIGRLSTPQAKALGLSGLAGRASGRAFDARSLRSDAGFAGQVQQAGDAAARCRLRLAEIETSLVLIGRLLDIMPEGETSAALPMLSGEGVGSVESARGDVWHWLRLDHGQIAAIFPRDPGWALWPAAEWALAGAALEDAAAIQRSFGLSASGADL